MQCPAISTILVDVFAFPEASFCIAACDTPTKSASADCVRFAANMAAFNL